MRGLGQVLIYLLECKEQKRMQYIQEHGSEPAETKDAVSGFFRRIQDNFRTKMQEIEDIRALLKYIKTDKRELIKNIM